MYQVALSNMISYYLVREKNHAPALTRKSIDHETILDLNLKKAIERTIECLRKK